MNIIKNISRSQWIVLITFLIGALLILWLGIWLLLGFNNYDQEIQGIEPRLSRLYGLLQVEDQLKSSELRAVSEINGLVYAGTDGNDALGAQMQQSARDLFVSAGLSVTGTQILAPKKDELFTRIGVGVNASGDIQSLEAALLKLIEARPLMFVDSLDIRPERRRSRSRSRRSASEVEEQSLMVRIQVVSMKLEGP